MSDHMPGLHELFLPEEEGDDPPEVVYISVSRFTNGGQEHAGRTFDASEIPNGEQLIRRFGGGEYLLKSRDEKKRVTAHRRVFFTGPSKSMNGGPDPVMHAPVPGSGDPQAIAQAVAQAVVQALGSRPTAPAIDPTLLAMLTSAHDANMAMAQSMITRGDANSKAMMETVTQFAQKMAEVRSAATAPTDASDKYKEGMEFGMEIAKTIGGSDDSSGLGEIASALQMMANGGNRGTPAPAGQ